MVLATCIAIALMISNIPAALKSFALLRLKYPDFINLFSAPITSTTAGITKTK